jgi:hypothetical protein
VGRHSEKESLLLEECEELREQLAGATAQLERRSKGDARRLDCCHVGFLLADVPPRVGLCVCVEGGVRWGSVM